ncbi:hypothetical protein ILUMI_25810 [Ignelater luminosus]|uniref:Uncharacterized protein n=1 Tax=Ignelater luminosus TaxID=2038154 RepID=A0A8K0FZJ9_IGNLU|nr:hypothetical protein ILUMI_25810 [Ignelater luminosus]
MKLFLFTLCLVTNIYYGMAKVIPSNNVLADRVAQPCSKSVPNYDECFLDYIRKFQKQMLNGIREMNIPNFNPFHLPVFSVNRTINDMASISAEITDVKIWGFDKMEFKKFKFDPEAFTGETEVYLPQIKLSLDYDATGKLFSPSPLTDTGHFKANLTDVTGGGTFSLKTIEKMGVKYFNLDNIQLTGNVGGANVKMMSKKSENQGVADFVSNFINEDPQRVFKALAPAVQDTAETIARLIIDQILNTVPANELVPE